MPTPPRTPAECFSTILLWLSRAVDARNVGGRLAVPVIVLILNRIRAISHRFARLAARIGAGTYVPRRPTTPRPHTIGKPRRPNPLPQSFAWLVKLVPEAAVYGSQLQYFFADPEMAALMEAAPGAMRRPLRSLCRMLGVTPPPILERDHTTPIRKNPSPAKREREGPVAERREGEGVAAERERRAPPPRRPNPPPPPITPHACGPPLALPA